MKANNNVSNNPNTKSNKYFSVPTTTRGNRLINFTQTRVIYICVNDSELKNQI